MFAPIQSALRLEPRQQQRHLGWAIVDSMDREINLVGEARTGTGKSFAYLVPSIYAVKNGQKRVVVSTETTALQDQIVKKDLPNLFNIYGGFKYRALKGRTWYFCYNRARMNSRGTQRIADMVAELGRFLQGGLGDGERLDIEKRLGYELEKDDWDLISGSTEFCADNKCDGKVCFSARARDLALDADIVVTNHAMLRTEAEMRDSDLTVLGDFEILIVDEAHTLERALVDGWTQSLSPWDISKLQTSILEGMQASQMAVSPDLVLEEEVSRAFDGLDDAMANITEFFKMRAEMSAGDRPMNWNQQNFPLGEVYLSGFPSDKMLTAMTEYETLTPTRIKTLVESLQRAEKFLKNAAEEAEDQAVRGRRKIRKGLRASRTMQETLGFIERSLPTRDGIVMHFGVPHGVIVEGINTRRGGDTVRLNVVPLDISGKAARLLWADKTSILLSATLTDPTDGTFTYTAASLGVTEYQTVVVDSPFTYAQQQLVYVTPGEAPVVDVYGARYSFEELLDVIHASSGRTLVLFTARAELDNAYEEMRDLKKRGLFPYSIYFQDKKTPKQKLVDQFKTDENSVLLATKSFFTGVDFPGATCTTVAICKFPLPQYNTLCRQQITWWRSRGFPKWYERESLLVFAQAAGRLIRSETDHGVVALLDQRCADSRTTVYKTAEIGLNATGSSVTQSLDTVREFLAQKAHA